MSNLTISLPITDPTLIFFVVLCIILFAPIIMGKLHIPHIVGMVLAGILVGPYGLNLLARDLSFVLFGKVGLLYIMFLAGLEMNFANLLRKRTQFVVFGLLSFFIPFVLAYFTGRWLLDYSCQSSLLFSCILASNTLIAYPIVSKYGLQRHHAVTLGVGASMISLTLSLLVLATLTAVNHGGAGLAFWVLFLIKIALLFGLSFLIIPRLTRWFFLNHTDSVYHFIYILCVLFLCAAISELCGLEGILGAFLAGLLLNRFIPSVSPLMNRLEFVGNALFIPYFLIGVGMLINVRVLFYGWETLCVVLCMVIIGTLSKAIAAYTSCLSFRFPLLSGHMMFGLTEAHAAGVIAMAMVGMKLQLPNGNLLVDATMLNGIVIMVLFTCIISSMVVDRSSRNIVLKEKIKPEISESSGDDEKILLLLQHDETVDALVNLAIMTSNRRLNRGLIGLHVVYDDIYSTRNHAHGLRLLERASIIVASADMRIQTQSRLAVNIANGMIHAFKEYDASEIITGLHRPGDPGEGFWGSYAEGIVGGINRQIMICRITQSLSTIRMIHVAVPSRAEFEPGFYRWTERMARLSDSIGCRIVFYGRGETTSLIESYIYKHHPDLRASFGPLNHWKDFPTLSDKVSADHLLVVITARSGTVSYKHSFNRLPDELDRYFSECSLIIIYPDQNGIPQGRITFTVPQMNE